MERKCKIRLRVESRYPVDDAARYDHSGRNCSKLGRKPDPRVRFSSSLGIPQGIVNIQDFIA
jgi:hypothetical protein